jgi:aerobic carbon-monoxide dehydrogenase medium subunit
MKPAPFGYFAPTNVDEVRDLLNQYGDDAKILAGGQSLVPLMALWLSQPSVVIYNVGTADENQEVYLA